PSCVLSVLSLAPVPTSTLFPYTTLFRSGGNSHFARRRLFPRSAGCAANGKSVRVRRDWDSNRLPKPHIERERHDVESRGLYLNRDRKSTRLNSSHQIISYAVFCLKKKKH